MQLEVDIINISGKFFSKYWLEFATKQISIQDEAKMEILRSIHDKNVRWKGRGAVAFPLRMIILLITDQGNEMYLNVTA